MISYLLALAPAVGMLAVVALVELVQLRRTARHHDEEPALRAFEERHHTRGETRGR